MFIFITTFVLTGIIGLCFFKNKFWENRYLLLLIGAGVALVVTLTVNYSVRGSLETKVVDIKKKSLHTFALPDSIFPDSTYSTRFIKDWDFYNDHSREDFVKKTDDSTQVFVSFLLYTDDDDEKDKQTVYFGSFIGGDRKYIDVAERYITPSHSDSIGYFSKKKVIYDIPESRWLSSLGFPRIKTIRGYHVPPNEFAMLPDSLTQKPSI